MPQRPKILIVDDSEVIRLRIKKALSRFDLLLEEAQDGEQAKQILDRKDFDLVTLDLHMPNLNGFELLQWMESKRKEEMILIISVDRSRRDIVEAMSSGGKSILFKPFQLDELLEKIKLMLSDIELTLSPRVERVS